MDTSKEYIKMCEKAVEIQDIFKKRGLGENDFINRDKKNPKRKGFNLIIWLPRQDQLQGVYDDNKGFTHQTLHHFIAAYNRGLGLHNSMEQLWLAFVMKEKYSKVWNGEEWKSTNDK